MNKKMSVQSLMALLCIAGNSLMQAGQNAPAASTKANPAVVASNVQAIAIGCVKTAEKSKNDVVDEDVAAQEKKIRELIRLAYKHRSKMQEAGKKEITDIEKTPHAEEASAAKTVPYEHLAKKAFICSMAVNLVVAVALNDAEKRKNLDDIRSLQLLENFLRETNIPIQGARALDILLLNSLVVKIPSASQELYVSSEELVGALEDHAVQLFYELREKFKARGELESISNTFAQAAAVATCVRACDLWHAYGVIRYDIAEALERQRKLLVEYSVPLCELMRITAEVKDAPLKMHQ